MDVLQGIIHSRKNKNIPKPFDQRQTLRNSNNWYIKGHCAKIFDNILPLVYKAITEAFYVERGLKKKKSMNFRNVSRAQWHTPVITVLGTER